MTHPPCWITLSFGIKYSACTYSKGILLWPRQSCKYKLDNLLLVSVFAIGIAIQYIQYIPCLEEESPGNSMSVFRVLSQSWTPVLTSSPVLRQPQCFSFIIRFMVNFELNFVYGANNGSKLFLFCIHTRNPIVPAPFVGKTVLPLLDCPWWWLATKLCPTHVTPRTVARQAPLFMGFPRQKYWSG